MVTAGVPRVAGGRRSEETITEAGVLSTAMLSLATERDGTDARQSTSRQPAEFSTKTVPGVFRPSGGHGGIPMLAHSRNYRLEIFLELPCDSVLRSSVAKWTKV